MAKQYNNEVDFIEFDNEFEDPWTRVPNFILDETELSARSIGIYVKIVRFQKSKKHKVYIKSLSSTVKEGRDAVAKAIDELIDFGYITRIDVRNERGHFNGYSYRIHVKPYRESVGNSTNEPITENPISDNPISDFTLHKKKIEKKENKKKENNVVVVEEKETQLLELYKSFNLEKRVMPHTTKLLKENLHIDLDVFEEIFIAASGDDVPKKFAYVRKVISELNKNNITTLDQYNAASVKHKESNTKKSKGPYTPKKNKFHNFNQRIDKMTDKEIYATLKKSQKAKFGSCMDGTQEINDPRKTMYENCLAYGWDNVLQITRENALAYAIENNLEYPNMEF